jgi:hypothetical protein
LAVVVVVVVVVDVVVVVVLTHGPSAAEHDPLGVESGGSHPQRPQPRRIVSQEVPSEVDHRQLPLHPDPVVVVVGGWSHGFRVVVVEEYV